MHRGSTLIATPHRQTGNSHSAFRNGECAPAVPTLVQHGSLEGVAPALT